MRTKIHKLVNKVFNIKLLCVAVVLSIILFSNCEIDNGTESDLVVSTSIADNNFSVPPGDTFYIKVNAEDYSLSAIKTIDISFNDELKHSYTIQSRSDLTYVKDVVYPWYVPESLNEFKIKIVVESFSGAIRENEFMVSVDENAKGNVVDIEGNLYSTIVINQKRWFCENLNATKFNNGDNITETEDSYDWRTQTSSGYCKQGYLKGNIYNWYTVADERNVCPDGWHVPTTDEWANLINYAKNQTGESAKPLKSTTGWQSGSNLFDFNMKLCGGRNYNGGYRDASYESFVWSSTSFFTEDNIECYLFKSFTDDSDDITNYYSQYPNTGCYIRCVKDGNSGTTQPKVYIEKITPGIDNAKCDLRIEANSNVVDYNGVCWSEENSVPTVNDFMTRTEGYDGYYTHYISDLQSNTTYYVRPFIVCNGQTIYGAVEEFTTTQQITLTLGGVSNVTNSSVTLIANIVQENIVTQQYGFVLCTTDYSPTCSGANCIVYPVSDGVTSHFEYTLNELPSGTSYNYSAYAIVDEEYYYSKPDTFSTRQVQLEVGFYEYSCEYGIQDITSSSASVHCWRSNGTIIRQGVLVNTEPVNEYINDYEFISEETDIDFNLELVNLACSTRYYIRPFVEYADYGIVLGDMCDFVTGKCIQYGSVEDIDGNNYNTVIIGGQEWMAENLRVTRYPGGDEITYVSSDYNWENLYDNDVSAAYCYYNNTDQENVLYTYAAAKDACPYGWHLPSDDEWKILELYIGVSPDEVDYIGHHGEGLALNLKSTEMWESGVPGTNMYGFTALPTGTRSSIDGAFSTASSCETVWWSNTEYPSDSNSVYTRSLTCNDYISYYKLPKSYGISVRCVKD